MKKNSLKMLGFAFSAAVVFASCGSDGEGSSTTNDQVATTADEPSSAEVTTTIDDVAEASTTAVSGATSVAGAAETTVNADESAALVEFSNTGSFGDIAVNSDGMTLYGFVPDLDAKKVTCEGGCATAWPPVTVPSEELPEGLSAELFSVTEGPNGFQLQIADVPLYLYQSDSAPGDTKGQGVGSKWYVVGPDGSLIKS